MMRRLTKARPSIPLFISALVAVAGVYIDAHGRSKDRVPDRAAIHYVLDLIQGGEGCRFRVDLHFTGGASGETRLRLPSGWFGQGQLYNQIRTLRAASADTRIADTSETHVKLITHPPNAAVHVQYEVVQDWPGGRVRD
jgi:hypothetical protein